MSTTKPHILIAEDDPTIREGLLDLLESEGFEVTAVSDGKGALETFSATPYDLVLLDIMMPEKSGFDVCRAIRRKNETVPILFLTAKSEEVDKVLGLELGADDYLTKPFGLRECLARVRALLRRAQLTGSPADIDPRQEETTQSTSSFTFCAARIDPGNYTATLPGHPPETLTAQEMKLVGIFQARPNQVLTRDQLLNLGWGIDYYGTTRTLDQHVAQLRKKCETTPANPLHLITVHGVGYRYAK